MPTENQKPGPNTIIIKVINMFMALIPRILRGRTIHFQALRSICTDISSLEQEI